MRLISATAVLVLLTASVEAADVTAASRVEAVTVFPSGAEVTRVAKLQLDKGDHVVTFAEVPAEALPGSIRVEGKATGKLEIGSVDSRRLFITSTEAAASAGERKRLEDEIDRLRDERALLDGQIEAGKTQVQLLKNLAQLPLAKAGSGGTQGAAPREDWGQIVSLIGNSMSDVQKASQDAQIKIRETDKRIGDLEIRLAALAPSEEERTEVKVYVTAAAPLEADLTVRYQVQSASWSPLYDARLATGAKTVAPKLTLTRRASISQQTGEPWDEVALTLSTTRPTAGTAAPELRTATVDYEPERKPQPVGVAPAPMARSAPGQEAAGAAPREAEDRSEKDALGKVAMEARQRGAEAVTAPFQALFSVPGKVSIANTGEAKRVQLQEDSIEPALAVRSVPKLDAKAYLYAKLAVPKGAPVLPGPVSLFRDGTFVGAGRLPLLVGAEEHELGFGVDDLVRVRHAIAEEKRGETGLISSSRTDQKDYRITIKNMHERSVQLTVMDQIPVSKNEEIKVELLGRTAPTKRDVDDKRGVLAWEAKLEPDEERIIEFGYRVTWPAAKSIIYGR